MQALPCDYCTHLHHDDDAQTIYCATLADDQGKPAIFDKDAAVTF